MSAYHDNEELEKLKAWWKNYGGALLIGVALGIAALFGNKYWTEYKERRLHAASDIYAAMIEQVRAKQTDAARTNAEKLTNEYEATPYAGLAALTLARLSVDLNKLDEARQHLTWAVENASDPAVAHTARARLARLYIDSRDYDAALELTKQKPLAGFESEYAEIRGDVYAAQGQLEQAREAYREALTGLTNNAAQKAIVTMKLQDLGAAASK